MIVLCHELLNKFKSPRRLTRCHSHVNAEVSCCCKMRLLLPCQCCPMCGFDKNTKKEFTTKRYKISAHFQQPQHYSLTFAADTALSSVVGTNQHTKYQHHHHHQQQQHQPNHAQLLCTPAGWVKLSAGYA